MATTTLRGFMTIYIFAMTNVQKAEAVLSGYSSNRCRESVVRKATDTRRALLVKAPRNAVTPAYPLRAIMPNLSYSQASLSVGREIRSGNVRRHFSRDVRKLYLDHVS